MVETQYHDKHLKGTVAKCTLNLHKVEPVHHLSCKKGLTGLLKGRIFLLLLQQ